MFDRAGLSVSSGLLLLLLSATAYTDLRRRRIYNAITYPGIVLALLLNAAGSLAELMGWSSPEIQKAIGWIGLGQSLLGLLACGGILLICFVFFSLRGGDVKLMAMIGAFLGLRVGIEVLLWSFVIGAAIAVVLLIWRYGAWELLRGAGMRLGAAMRLRDLSQLASPADSPLKTMLDLAPSALVAFILVHWQLLGPVQLL